MTEKDCREIYRASFCDPDTVFEDLLFENCYEYCRTYEKNGETVSMLFLLPVKIEYENKIFGGSYLYAAATNPEYRKQGFMGELLKKAKAESDFIILRPANEKLIGYYASFGFKTVTAGGFSDAFIVSPKGGYAKLIKNSGMSDKNSQFTAMYYSKNNIELQKINFSYSMN